MTAENSGDLPPRNGLLGAEIRRLRKIRKKTLTQLSEATGLSVGYLSQVERDRSSPTVKAMFDISHALGVTINWFFNAVDTEKGAAERFVVRANRRATIEYDSGICDSRLNTEAVDSFELLLCRFEPNSPMQGEPYNHDGEECGYVLSGQFHLKIDGELYDLGEGDSFSFPSTLAHQYCNPGDTETLVLWCVSPPSY
ncbi:MAG: cupin domain-containing protein [Pseudomonadota bacterium]